MSETEPLRTVEAQASAYYQKFTERYPVSKQTLAASPQGVLHTLFDDLRTRMVVPGVSAIDASPQIRISELTHTPQEFDQMADFIDTTFWVLSNGYNYARGNRDENFDVKKHGIGLASEKLKLQRYFEGKGRSRILDLITTEDESKWSVNDKTRGELRQTVNFLTEVLNEVYLDNRSKPPIRGNPVLERLYGFTYTLTDILKSPTPPEKIDVQTTLPEADRPGYRYKRPGLTTESQAKGRGLPGKHDPLGGGQTKT